MIPGGVTPSVIRAFAGDDGGVGSMNVGLRGWRGRWVKDEVADAGEDSGSEKIPFSSSLLLLSAKKLAFGTGQFPSCIPKLQHGCLVMCYLCCHSNVIEGSNSIIDKKALPDTGLEHPKMHVVDV